MLRLYNYSTITRRLARPIFFERFWEKLEENLEKCCGKEKSEYLKELLKRGSIKIKSPETFIFAIKDISDTSIKWYNRAKSFDDFFFKSLLYFKKRAEIGETDITVREFFFTFIDALSNEDNRISDEKLSYYIKTLLMTLLNSTHISPFRIQVPEPFYAQQLQKYLGLDMSQSSRFYEVFLTSFCELAKDEQKSHVKKNNYRNDDRIIPSINSFFPPIQIIYPAYRNTKKDQVRYLASMLYLNLDVVEECTEDLATLDEDTPALRVALERLLTIGKMEDANIEDIISELRTLKDTNKKRHTFSMYESFIDRYKSATLLHYVLADPRITRVIVDPYSYPETFQSYYSCISIDCSNLLEKDIPRYIDAACDLSMTKYNSFHKVQHELFPYENCKISLENVKDLSQTFLDLVSNKIEQVRSLTNKNFFMEVSYNASKTDNSFKKEDIENVRIISDIHADYNKGRGYSFNFGNDFVINCGDTASDAIVCAQWNKINIQKGVMVEGNHLGYLTSPQFMKSKLYTKESQMRDIRENLADSPNIRYLENTLTEFQGMIILGTCLYSDFALYGKDNEAEAMNYAQRGMNDFKVVTCETPERWKTSGGQWRRKDRFAPPRVRAFTPADHAYAFHLAYNFLKEKVAAYANKPIIIATHFAPSIYSIDPKYAGSPINPAFASNLNEFIIKNPSIRLWAHGHVHSPCDYILGSTRVVCEPFGYNNENNAKLPKNYGKQIPISYLNSKEPWTTLCAKEIESGKIKVYTS